MSKKYLNFYVSCLFILTGIFTFAQQTITGTVSDSDGPLPGASVFIKGTGTGVVTDFDGNYSIEAGANDILVFSYVGFIPQELTVGVQTNISLILLEDTLEEVVVIGYGSQDKKEITSAVAVVGEEDFNRGTVNSPTQLLQGRVAGLSIYNRGDNPTQPAVIRLRGLSTVGANTQPLIIIDGIIGGSLDNVDPNDISDITVLKDGSAAAIYGTRGSSGVILITTKTGKEPGTRVEYNGQAAISQINSRVNVMTPSEARAAGLTDVGGETDWLKEVTRDAFTNIHNISIAGANDKTNYRVSLNLRDVEGILDTQKFQRFNSRVNFTTKILNDKLKVDFNASYTRSDINYGFTEALRYAVLFNPLAPVRAEDTNRTLYPVSTTLYGGYFENFGVFDSFNPRAILDQNLNLGNINQFNYAVNLNYNFTDAINVNLNIAEQNISNSNRGYRGVESHWAGNATNPLRRGQALFSYNENKNKLYEVYGNYKNTFSDLIDLSFTLGYSYNLVEDGFGYNFDLGGFPDDSQIKWLYNIGVSQDLIDSGRINAGSYRTPEDKISAQFARLNLTYDNAVFFNASVRREGSTRLGSKNKWGFFPSLGLGVDLNKYIGLDNVDLFKVRAGYGVTGSLPPFSGLSQTQYNVVRGGSQPTGGFSTASNPNFAPNPDLQWEEKTEINIGVEFQMDRLGATVDVFRRNNSNFLFNVEVDPSSNEFGVTNQWRNAGESQVQGIEVGVNYDIIRKDNFTYNAGLLAWNYINKLIKYTGIEGQEKFVTANLGSPGQNDTNLIIVREGEKIGQIWGPVFTGEVDADGSPILKDVNGDGQLLTAQDNALAEDGDFEVLGNGYPLIEASLSQSVSIGNWDITAFIRGAFGHSLVNTYRAFYEPRVGSQASYNLVNTKYARDDIKTAQFSSYYVEKADFVRLDNIVVAYTFDFPGNEYIKNLTLSLTAQNPITITGYTGVNPEPALQDSFDGNVLAPGIDRRGTYFASRTITLGLQAKF